MSRAAFNRADLTQRLQVARPALSKQSFIPVLNHFCFTGKEVVAYNDLAAIIVPLVTEFQGALPGDLLIKMLSSLGSESVTVIEEDNTVLITGGRSRLKLPKMATSDFIFNAEKAFASDPMSIVEVNAEFLQGMDRCLVSVGSDPTHPAQMGVTFHASAKGDFLYTTDNYTVSRASLKSVKHTMPTDEYIIFPTFFCEQLGLISRGLKDDTIELEYRSGSVLATFSSGVKLFSKVVMDLEPLDFAKIVSRYHTDGATKGMDLPAEFDDSFSRALLVLEGNDDKATSVSTDGKRMTLISESPSGRVQDIVNFDGDLGEREFHIDPELVARGSKACKQIYLPDTQAVVMMNGDTFLHLVATLVRK